MKFSGVILLVLFAATSGCGGFAARRIAQAPNSYPKWLAPKAPVVLEFNGKLLTAFTNEFLRVDSPKARIRYRVIEPGNYELRWTNQVDQATGQLKFSFGAEVDDSGNRTNRWTAQPRGTVVLLHGYGVAGFAMFHWGMLLAQEGWRCVLVDLRGHGKSTGRRIYFGAQETKDLSALIGKLRSENRIVPPISVLGDSFGAVVALKWKLSDPSIDRVVAISPYANLTKATLNITHQYAGWMPDWFIESGVRHLPKLLRVDPAELDPESWIAGMKEHAQAALFIAGSADKIAPVQEAALLCERAGSGSKLLVIPGAAHEPLPFYLDELAPPVIQWLRDGR